MKTDWLPDLLDFKDALCNLETSLLEKEPADAIRLYIIRANRRWQIFIARIQREIGKLSS